MALAPGGRLGPYAIISALGAGGMGEVHQARDTCLDRTVAVKVLPEHVARDRELKQRFEREAKTISSLKHGSVILAPRLPHRRLRRCPDDRGERRVRPRA